MPGAGGSTSTTAERVAEFESAAAEARRIYPAGAAASEDTGTAAGAAATAADTPEQKHRASLFVAEVIPWLVLAQMRGDHWRITELQVRDLAPLWAQVLDKYFGDRWWQLTGPEAQLILTLGMIFLAKQREEKALIEAQAKAAAEASASVGKPTGAPSENGGKPPEWESGPAAKV